MGRPSECLEKERFSRPSECLEAGFVEQNVENVSHSDLHPLSDLSQVIPLLGRK